MIDLNRYQEVIGAMACKLSDGSEVRIQRNLETGTGEIEVHPWSSYQEGDMFSTSEDHVTFAPVNGNDFLVLELMYEHAKEVRAKMETEQDEPAIFGTPEERKKIQSEKGSMFKQPVSESMEAWVTK